MNTWFTVETINGDTFAISEYRHWEDFVLDDYKIFKGTPQEILHDGDCLSLGNRTLTVVSQQRGTEYKRTKPRKEW